MATIAEQLLEMKRIKEGIKSKLESLGLVDSNTPFEEYSSRIQNYKDNQLSEFEMFLTKNFGSFYENTEITGLDEGCYAFEGTVSETVFSFPNLEYIRGNGFSGSKAISISIPVCKEISYGVQTCSKLQHLYAPMLETLGKWAITYTEFESFDYPRLKSLGEYSFAHNKKLRKIWIPKTCTSVTGTPFLGCMDSEGNMPVMYCEFASKPASWSSTFNKISSSDNCTVIWGSTRKQFEEA